MKKISVEEALILAFTYYPQSPEKIIEKMGVKVIESDSITAEGWCLQRFGKNGEVDKAQITINSKMAKVRQRFTLAHELAHILLGIPQAIGEFTSINAPRETAEERKVDKLAAELLLPERILLDKIKIKPITASLITSIARNAKVSSLVVALRIESLHEKLSIDGAMVIFYESNTYKFHSSKSLRFDSKREEAQSYLDKCLSVHPEPVREDFDDENIVVASLIDNPGFNTKIVFLQTISKEQGYRKLPEEKIRELKEYLFKDNPVLGRSIDSRLAAFNVKAQKLPINVAIKTFYERLFKYNEDMIEENRGLLMSKEAEEYFRLKLQGFVRR